MSGNTGPQDQPAPFAGFTEAGQIAVGTGAGTGELLDPGTAGQVLTIGGADPSGLEWAAGGGGGGGVTSYNTRTGAVTGQESDFWMPGVVAGGGAVDNYAAITAYLTAAGFIGQNNMVLPPGPVGVSAFLAIPTGVILRGSGHMDQPGTTFAGGTRIVPTTGSALSTVVTLSAPNAGLQDLDVDALPFSLSNSAATAVTLDAETLSLRNVGMYGGTVCTLLGTNNAVEIVMSDVIVKSLTGSGAASTVYAIQSAGSGWQVNNIITSGGTCQLHASGCRWVNFHCIGSSGGNAAHANAQIIENGQQDFVGLTLDSLDNNASAMVDRTGANHPSTYSNIRLIQNGSTVAGNPVFLETTTAGAGAIIENVTGEPLPGSATFTYFIQGAIASTIVANVNVPAGFANTAFTNLVAPLGSFSRCYVAGVLVFGGAPAGSSFVTGAYYPLATLGGTESASAQGVENAFPFSVRETVTPVSFGINVASAGSAGAKFRIGIRIDNGGQPGALVADLGTVPATATGEQDAAAVVTLAPGDYWATTTLQGAPATAAFCTGVQANPSYGVNLGWVGSATSPSWFQTPTGYAQLGVAGALPAGWTVDHTVGAACVPCMAMRT